MKLIKYSWNSKIRYLEKSIRRVHFLQLLKLRAYIKIPLNLNDICLCLFKFSLKLYYNYFNFKLLLYILFKLKKNYNSNKVTKILGVQVKFTNIFI